MLMMMKRINRLIFFSLNNIIKKMSSSLFNDLQLSAAQLNTDYRLSKLNQAGLQLDAVVPQVEAIQGDNARNNILIGDAITNVPDAATSANMVIIGDGDKVNAKSGTIALGNGALLAENILQLVGADLAAVADAAGADTTKFLRFNYKGTIYKVTLLADA
jgi:hypothetical protein